MNTFITICLYVTLVFTALLWFKHFNRMFHLLNEEFHKGIWESIGGCIGFAIQAVPFLVTLIYYGSKFIK